MKKKKLNVSIPDADYWKKQIKCQSACPVNTDARGYVRAISEGNFENAYLIARGPNPLASTCGRICAAPCEASCRRGDVDDSVSIRALKRSAIEKGSDFNLKPLEIINKIKNSIENADCTAGHDLGNFVLQFEKGNLEKVKEKSVGIIGAGPAGLACAHDLALFGFSVTIYELEVVTGGMLSVGIPAYRLPRELVKSEVDVIKSLGVNIITGCRVGKDISLDEIKKQYDSVVIAIGLKESRKIPINGSDKVNVIGGVEFLRNVYLGNKPKIGKKVIVVGGGNTAFDVARTAIRLQEIEGIKNGEVSLCCIEDRDAMLADEIEVTEGIEEGVQLLNEYGPHEVISKGKISLACFKKIISIFDEEGRFNPQYDISDIKSIKTDTIFLAIGQQANLSFIDEERDGIKLNPRGFIECDKETWETSCNDVYVSGDLAHGAKLVIDAVSNGKNVAKSIYQKTLGKKLKTETVENHVELNHYSREKGFENLNRDHAPVFSIESRKKSIEQIVEKVLPIELAHKEGSRCYDCSINTIFDGNRCILCGGCADICPENCLKLISVDDLSGDKKFDDLISVSVDIKESNVLTAIIKNEERCIRCALCEKRCPASAITMEKYRFKESICYDN